MIFCDIRSSVENILSCRLVLNLRRLSHSSSNQSVKSVSTPDLLFTASGILGNIGEPLRTEHEEMIDFEEDVEPCNCDVCPTAIRHIESREEEDFY